MKSLAQMYVLWPGMDSDIEKLVWGCSECQAIQSSPPTAPLPYIMSYRIVGNFCGVLVFIILVVDSAVKKLSHEN